MKLNKKIKTGLLWLLTLTVVCLLAYLFVLSSRFDKQRRDEKARECQSSGQVWNEYKCQTKYDACLHKIASTYNYMNDTGIAVANDNESVHLEITRCLENF